MTTMKIAQTNKNRIKKYQKAFEQYSGAKSDEFDTKEYWKGGSILIQFKDHVYQVDSNVDMCDYFNSLVTEEASAIHIPIGHWTEVAEDVHLVPEFIENLASKLNKRELENLNIAINISDHAHKSATTFWETIYELDDIGLYPKAIIAACATYDKESIIEELMEEMITRGEYFFCDIEGGIFETIILCDDDYSYENDESIYYIYDVDPNKWDIAEDE